MPGPCDRPMQRDKDVLGLEVEMGLVVEMEMGLETEMGLEMRM